MIEYLQDDRTDEEKKKVELRMSEYDFDETIAESYEEGRQSAMPVVYLLGCALIIIILLSTGII